MPYATNGDARIYYETHGAAYADDDVDAVALCGELGYGPWQWGWQHAALAGPYELVVPATRGTGDPDADARSDAPPGPWSAADLAADLEAVLADAGVDSAHLVGVGLGGCVALTAALDPAVSSRVADLALVGTAASGGALAPDALWADPDDADEAEASLAAALSADFLADQPDVAERIADWRAAEDADRESWEAARAALDGVDLSDRLYEVTNPALVLHGSTDAVCPPERGRALAEGLPRGRFEPVVGAGHLANVDDAPTVNDRLLAFFGTDRE
ncbi:alpha/beta fold hydrolase [Candidatus Halobonum tyrrellensis]|uniref:Alpha/beta hydrolase fold protein n=1 Tax=Candidatus Halobonum tyrrellensis G22 TaxID=1324957 RepID=V4GU40_9EURY|nr:alpha/beta fold hydrolase [Candidatus Halobonum tyrrellensis]ESP88646.1 alpha/beta hydrolase fold protein [Candidatus Halobonum tyrrellensis G22]